MKKVLLTAALVACMATPALATGHMMSDSKAKMMADHWFMKVDTNNDGMITKEESTAFNDKIFAETDANNDGKISKAEMEAMKMKEHKNMEAHHAMKSGKMMKDGNPLKADMKETDKNEMEVDKPMDNSANTDETNDK